MEAAHAMEPHPIRTRRTLLESLGASVIDIQCRAGVEPAGPEELNLTHSIVFVRRGVFGCVHRGEALIADANHVLFFNADEPYRYSHPVPGGDECTVLAVDGPLALELVARHSPWDAEHAEAPFRLRHGLSSSRTVRLQYELLALLRRPVPKLGVEDTIAELADEAVGAAYRARGARTIAEPTSSAAARRRRDLTEATIVAVNDRLDALPSLCELARGFACSPFHLSRTFHRTVGLSLRSYAQRLRVRRAADHLAGGAHDLTDLALELGYADHSHFTNAFRREWGMPPSRFRDALRAAVGPRNNLQAAAGTRR